MKRNASKIEFQKNWNDVYETLADNLALMFLVLHNEYGFGRERIGKLLYAMQDMAKRFDEYQADGVLDIKRAQLTEEFLEAESLHEFLKIRLKGVVPDEFYNDMFCNAMPTFHEAQAKYKRNTQKQQKNISFSEAAEIQQRVLAMKEFYGDKNELL